MIRRPRISPTIVLTGIVLVLLPLLASLQYHWLARIGQETGTRMRAVAMSAGEALSADLAFEVGRAWRERLAASGPQDGVTASPPLVVDALILDGHDGDDERVRVRRWNLDSRQCEVAAWPAAYGSIGDDGHVLLDQLERRSTVLGVVPIVLQDGVDGAAPVHPPCEIAGRGMVLFRLDAVVLRRSLLPEVARRHLAALESDDFLVAVVSGPDGQDAVYASAGVDAAAVAAQPDLVVPLTLATIDRGGRGGRGRGGRESPGVGGGDGHGRGQRGRPPRGDVGDGWRLVARHRAGSLESAVEGLRTRNLVISLGILSLLGVAVAMIAANARRAERLGRQQVEFVAAVSHEMRTPVTGIELAARNLEDGLVADPARVQRYGGVIRTEARRLAETVERVLQFAALEAGRGVGPAADVDVQAVAEDVVARARAEHHQATIELDVVAAPAVIRSDATALRSAIQNLLANALKYGGTPAWARVRIVQAGAATSRPELCVTVEDHGPGIDPRDVPHVFEAFYRGRLATERRAPGNGLGLHIVKRSIEGLGGRVTLQTHAGSGTAVTLHLPLAAPPAGAPASGPAHQRASTE